MGIRFYRSKKILPGFRANVSKSGLSATVGIRGANMNVGRRGKRYTLGLPGTGLSYVKFRRHSDRGRMAGGSILRYMIIVICLIVMMTTLAAIIAY